MGNPLTFLTNLSNKFNRIKTERIAQQLEKAEKTTKDLSRLRIMDLNPQKIFFGRFNNKDARLANQIRSARNARSQASHEAIKFMQANPELGRVLKSGNRGFSSPEAIAGINAARLKAFKDSGYGLNIGDHVLNGSKKAINFAKNHKILAALAAAGVINTAKNVVQDDTDDSLLVKIPRGFSSPVTTLLNKMYPFGYYDGKTSQKLQDLGIPEDISKGIGIPVKIVKSVLGLDPAVDAASELRDMDLSKPENMERAKELVSIMRKEQPGKLGWSTSADPKRVQKSLQARYDQNLLHGGYPQKYGIFSKESGYKTNAGDYTYGYTDPKMAAEEKASISAYTKNNKYSKKGTYDDGTPYYVWEVEGQDPYAAHGGHTIISADSLGRKNTRDYDEWDFGSRKGPSTKYLPGYKTVKVGHKIN